MVFMHSSKGPNDGLNSIKDTNTHSHIFERATTNAKSIRGRFTIKHNPTYAAFNTINQRPLLYSLLLDFIMEHVDHGVHIVFIYIYLVQRTKAQRPPSGCPAWSRTISVGQRTILSPQLPNGLTVLCGWRLSGDAFL